MSESKFRFNINPNVVFRLGEELITDEVQALVELVKNSYDADASWVKVTISSRGKYPDSSEFPEAVGYIVIEDDGTGMTAEEIEKGWLTIANSAKKHQKTQGLTTGRGRTPVGDKGLGRLGVQRLATNVEIISRPDSLPESNRVAFSWDDFRNRDLLQDVPVFVERTTRTTCNYLTLTIQKSA